MDQIQQLRVFLRVAESGSFTLAADQLGLPRPTVSLAIQQLESRLGTRLLHRTTRRVSLTSDGESLVGRALALVTDAEELEQQFRPDGGTLRGRIRVDLPSRVARRVVAPVLPEFLDRYPGIHLELGSSDRVIDLIHEGVDCALRVGALQSDNLVARPIGRLRIIQCASPRYLEQHGQPQVPADLSRHTVIQYAVLDHTRSLPWEWMERGEIRRAATHGNVSVDNVETYIACGLAGLGLIQIPAYDAAGYLAAGELVEVLHGWPAPSMPMHLVYPHRRHMSSLRLQAFTQWLTPVLQRSCCEEGGPLAK